MTTFLSAAFMHGSRILLLRHDGAGLPTTRGGSLLLIAVGCAASRLLSDLLSPSAFNLLTHVAFSVVYYGLLWKLMRPVPMAAVMLVDLVGSLVLSAVYVSVPEAALAARVGVFAWSLVALVVFGNTLVKRANAAAKRQS